MNNYKFRGKRKDNGEWVYGSLVSTSPDEAFILIGVTGHIKREDYECYMVEVVPESVGMWTGLKDKNGKNIYDGNLLKRTQRIDGNFVDRIFERYEVAYNSGIAGFEYKPIDGKDYKQYTVRPFGGDEIEIIGNIHDVNPAVQDSVTHTMNNDPNTPQQEPVNQEATEQAAEGQTAALESEEQDQAVGADAEEGSVEG